MSSISGWVKRSTIQRKVSPTAILVGLPDDLAATCTEVLEDGNIRVLRVGHVAAASERLPVVMPQLVVVTSSTLGPQDDETLTDRCVAVGAELLKLDPAMEARALRTTIQDAGTSALIRALRRSG